MNETNLIKEFGGVVERRKKVYQNIAMDGSLPYIKMQLARDGKHYDPESVGRYIDNLVMNEASIPKQLRKKTDRALQDYDFLIAALETHLNPESYHNDHQLRAKQEILAKRMPWIRRGIGGVEVASLKPDDKHDANQINAAFANVYRLALRNLRSFMEEYNTFKSLLDSSQLERLAKKKAV